MLRDQFQSRIEKGLLGAGSDSWGVDDSEELISDTPLNRYYTGILFPQMDLPKGEFDPEPKADDTTENDDEHSDDSSIEDNPNIETQANITEDKSQEDKENKEDEEKAINRFFPNSMGITFCLPSHVKTIQAEFSFGLYRLAKRSELKIKFPENAYQTLLNDADFPLAHLLDYNNGFLSLKKELAGFKGGKDKKRDGDYKKLDDYRKQTTQEIKKQLESFDRLLTTAWKRENIVIHKIIAIETIKKPIKIFDNEKTELEFYVTKFSNNDNSNSKCYVRLQLVNSSEQHPQNKFSNRNESLNQKSIFQTTIKIKTEQFLPYHQPKASHFDEEDKLLEFLYRDVKSYAIGHNCAAMWDKEEEPTEVWTTYTPCYDMKAIKNDFSELDFSPQDFSILNDSLILHHLSLWGKSKHEVIKQLKQFVALYEQWIIKQQNHEDANNQYAKKLIKNLDDNLKRLQDNIDLLQDDIVFKAFQYANTAMLLQISVTKNRELHKDLINLNHRSSPFKTLPTFKYRPFQLAFLILSIGDIVKPNLDTRKNTVDLIWFPTGGGKTEAYLAVTAFVLCYRRLIHPKNYQGVSVIMRYTLRLLTSQQFERASRLITALDILRQHFPNNLQKEPITIGLWIGMASTPNTINDDRNNKGARDKIAEIERECNKGLKGNPKRYNVFQVEQCTWCGEDLIQLKNEIWHNGFEIQKGHFIIRCVNPDCHFHKTNLPIQVVDECLYKKPPSLLFATVDKFAMLSWKEQGYVFFNSLTDGLPPDLIIQDELHLLSGPLGSLVGLFETVIELLCTKNNISPKIIASTATTRNTEKQVKELYGQHREVNIFPPSGLSYKDSFFAKEDVESKRRYLGIMPTGKTMISTQISLLTHLLVARLECYLQANDKEKEINPYWTIVSYYNTLRDVGRMNNKIGDEIYQFTKQLQNRLQLDGHFNYSYLSARTKELTSRIDSDKIKPTLSALENPFSLNESGYVDGQTVDMVLATNMLSVGIDISRLNLMQINGMPRNVAEYIQASSRVARQDKGLVIINLDPNRAREKSYFEHFMPFHQNIYRSVEPLSATAFTENTLDILLTSLLITYIRHKLGKDIVSFEKDDINSLLAFIETRFSQYPDILEYCKTELILRSDELEKIKNSDLDMTTFNQLLIKPSEKPNLKEEDQKIWVALQSLRDIDSNTFVQIQEHY